MKKKNSKISVGIPREDKIMYAIIDIFLVLILILVLYPLIYVVSCSFSSGKALGSGRVIFLPVEFSTRGYEIIFGYKRVWRGFANSIFYTVAGTAMNMFLTILAAYPLSRKDLIGKKYYMAFFMIIMFVSGGIIPSYILMSNLKLTNTVWSVLLSGTLSITNMIIMRTYFVNSIPYELFEAAHIDGIDDIGYLMNIVLPLSRSILAVLTLYYAVSHWNTYFNAMLYLRNRDLHPLQLVLREILAASQVDMSEISNAELLGKMEDVSEVMKYALIVVSTIPMMIAYPFVQKYFEKGIMIGSVKE